jgi:hypothetical protein
VDFESLYYENDKIDNLKRASDFGNNYSKIQKLVFGKLKQKNLKSWLLVFFGSQKSIPNLKIKVTIKNRMIRPF